MTELSPEGDKSNVRRLETQWKFKDKVRTIDFVLVWNEPSDDDINEQDVEKRKTFESNLEVEGLQIERKYVEETGLHFVKIYAPIEVLKRYAEILKLRLPMRQELYSGSKLNKQNSLIQISNFISKKIKILEKVPTVTKSYFGALCSCCENWFSRYIFVDRNIFPQFHHRFTAIYSRDKEYLFDWEAPGFFTPSNKARIVQFILDRTFFIHTEELNLFSFGLKQLIDSDVYSAAYPLHDGDLTKKSSLRFKLYHHWASIRKWYRYQPIDYIRNYFGVKIGLYFAWLGFYNYMLFPAAFVGLACFLISVFLLSKNKPTEDICFESMGLKMCPKCDYCPYWDLSETCLQAKLTFLFDNYTTVFFSVFMSLWAAMFLEMWKRYSAEITHRWDLTGFDTQEEHPRPQYLARLAQLDATHRTTYKVNVVTNFKEPKVPFWKMRLPATIFSFSVVLLLVTLAVAALIGVVLYRVSVFAALSVYGDPTISSYSSILTSGTAAFINLVTIFIFNWIYSLLAEYLTELEMLRTQTEFDDSLTLKMYLLQFVNYYASIFYIAFFKGHLIGIPSSYTRFFGHRMEECSTGGCLSELSIQLAIIMLGKQTFNTIVEMGYPMVYKWWTSRYLRNLSRRRSVYQWEKDYKLSEWGPQALFPEYLEMVLQYGFVTIFVSAFPLAPFFALLNNILETRLDAKKLLKFYRRPVPQRVKDIGVWFVILDSVSKLAVITNGFIIAFTSDFVPQLVYSLTVSQNHSLTGYLDHSLSYMSTEDLDMRGKPNSTLQYCRYKDYREPPWSPEKYERSSMFWIVLAARLAFVVVFENLVLLVVLGVKCLIPDVPLKLRSQIRREAYLTNEIIITQEAFRAKNMSTMSLDNINELESLHQMKHNHYHTKVRRTKSNPENTPDILPNTPHTSTGNFTKEQIQDAVMLHRPKSFGEIDEVTV